MRRILQLVLISFSPGLWAADSIQSDCTKPELKALKHKKILEQISPDAKLNAVDCTVLGAGKVEKLLTIYSMDTADGVETRVATFARGGLNPEAKPQFRSESLGFDSYLMVAHGRKRMLFVLPGGDGKSIAFYTNTQTDANNTQLLKHNLNLHEKTLSQDSDHAWKIDPGIQPKIYSEKGKWKAILKGKIVDL